MTGYSLPLNYEFTVYCGTSYKREFRWLPDGSNPIDFTGWSATMLVGQQLSEADVELSTANGGITLTSLGQIFIEMTPFQTGVLTAPITYYNLDLIEPGGFIRRFLRGRVSVVVDVKQRVTP